MARSARSRSVSSLVSLALAAGGLVLLSHASPALALSCSQRIVDRGDSSVYVRSVCGEPAGMTTRTESRSQFVYGPTYDGTVGGSSITVTVQIDVWVYDFGRTRFMEELTFENGVLRNIRTLGYGTNAGHPPRASIEREWRSDRVAIAAARFTRPRRAA